MSDRNETIPFIDLAAQQKILRGEIDRRIKAVLDHGQYVMGPEVAEFENALAAFCGAKHVVSTSSGTDALLLGLMALGVGAQDGVIVPSFTFAATAEVLPCLGAIPVFADIDGGSFNLDPAGLPAAMTAAQKAGVRVKGIIPVGLFGRPAAMEAIGDFAAEHGLWVMDDAAQSLGASIGGRKTGTLAAITATSFFPAKPLGCYGDGGAVITDDDGMADVMRSLRVHGAGAERYAHDRLGMTARLDTIQAAVLCAKLGIFEDELAKRDAIAARYNAALGEAVAVPRLDDSATSSPTSSPTSSWAQYCLKLPPAIAPRRGAIRENLAAQGIPTQIYYPKGMHEHPPYTGFPVAEGGLPITAEVCARALALPIHPYLEEATQDRIIKALLDALDK